MWGLCSRRRVYWGFLGKDGIPCWYKASRSDVFFFEIGSQSIDQAGLELIVILLLQLLAFWGDRYELPHLDVTLLGWKQGAHISRRSFWTKLTTDYRAGKWHIH